MYGWGGVYGIGYGVAMGMVYGYGVDMGSVWIWVVCGYGQCDIFFLCVGVGLLFVGLFQGLDLEVDHEDE